MQDGFRAKLQGQISASEQQPQQHKPRVSVGVPVYNGQRFIRATLDSILAQSYGDFEIIICDNASTDSTEQICREYVARDPRIRYIRNDRNIGPAPNYNKCFEHARGELFKWCAADDLMGPDFLKRCVEELDRDPALVAVWPSTKEIDVDGRELYAHDSEVDLAARSPAKRLFNYAMMNHRRHHATELWSVYRADVLRGWQPLKGSFPSADRLVVVHVILRGRMLRIPDFLFFNRSHGERSQTYLDRMKVRPGSRLVKYIGCGPLPGYEWWDASTKGRIVFPEWRWVAEYVRAVTDTPMPFGSKLACFGVCAVLAAKFIPRLGRDVVIAAEQLFNRLTGLAPKPDSRAPGGSIGPLKPVL